MHPPAAPAGLPAAHHRRLTRLPAPMSVLGVRTGQLVAWQLIVIAAVVALTQHGPGRWAAAAVAGLGCCLTLPRWRHRWAYEWLLSALSLRRARRALTAVPYGPAAGQAPPATWPQIDVTAAAKSRHGAAAGVAHDGDGFAVVLGLTPQAGAWPEAGLPASVLAGLLDSDDDVVTSVQVITHADLSGPAMSGPAAAYRSLGYQRLPRSASSWIALRHDPAASRYAVGMPGSAREVGASMVRALTGRGSRLADLVSEQHLSGRLLDADAARRLLTQTLLTGEADAPEPGPPEIGLPEIGTAPEAGVPGAGGPRPHRWRSCHSGTRQHVSYWLRRWPAYGLGALQQALSEVPALSVTTAVVLARGRGGRLGLAATVRVTTEPGAYGRGVGRAVSAAAASCGARLVRMDGEHHAGVLATLPLGREPGGRWLGWHSDGGDGTSTILPVAAGGVALGAGAGDSLVAISCFTAERATRTTVIGDALLPRLLALRALGSGARLQVITAQPGGWVKLRDHPEMPRERMFVVRPGTQPPGGATRADPWMVIDDTGSLESAGSGPWQAVVTILGQDCGPGAVMTGQDAIVLQRTSAPTAAAAAAAVGLDAAAGQALADLPDGGVAVARPGAAVEFAWLAPDPVERELLAGSMRPG